jgi:multimeric flavodoxin WrbA
MERGVARKSNNFRPKRTDVLWHIRKDDVMEEIGKILNVDKATTATPGWFSARTTAIKNIVDRMSPDELTELDGEVEKLKNTGYDEKHQRR